MLLLTKCLICHIEGEMDPENFGIFKGVGKTIIKEKTSLF